MSDNLLVYSLQGIINDYGSTKQDDFPSISEVVITGFFFYASHHHAKVFCLDYNRKLGGLDGVMYRGHYGHYEH